IGVRYSSQHAMNGFPRALVGVRLSPIQLVESVWIAISVAIGVFVILIGKPPGSALSWYVVLYGAGRFVFEFQRMDSVPHFNRFSEGQASSLILVAAAAGGELTGLLPFNVMHLLAASLLCGAALVVFVFEQSNQSNRAGSLSRQHLMEIADVMSNRALALESNRALALEHDAL